MSARLVLASGSKYRRLQLAAAGLSFEAVDPAVDEDAVKAEGHRADQLASRLAELKAQSGFRQAPGAIVVGGDQVVALGDEVLGKPGTMDNAVAQLMRLSGRTHTLLTALAVVHPGGVFTHLDVTRLTLRPLDELAIRRYVALDAPLDCAGAYVFERGGVALFSSVETRDPSAITGLPMIALVRLLDSLGVAVP